MPLLRRRAQTMGFFSNPYKIVCFAQVYDILNFKAYQNCIIGNRDFTERVDLLFG